MRDIAQTNEAAPAATGPACSRAGAGRQTRFFVGLVGLAGLMFCASLGLFAVGPVVLPAWRSVAITSGSMDPAIEVGDVVITRDYNGEPLGKGMIVTYDAGSGHPVTHRITEVNGDGTFVTKGDANAASDGRIHADQVLGVARFVVPYAGFPPAWIANGQIVHLMAFIVVLGVGLFFGRYAIDPRHDPWSPDMSPGEERPCDGTGGLGTDTAVWFADPRFDGKGRVISRRLLLGAPVVLLAVAAALLPTSNAAFTNPTSNDANAVATRTPIRVTTYQIPDGAFTGTSYSLSLAQDLTADYFVILRGAAGNNTGSGSVGPDANYARVTADPFGTGPLGTSGSPNVLALGRAGSTNNWQGQVTVLESPDNRRTAGFSLAGIAEVSFTDASTNAWSTVAGWADLGQVGLYGGSYGGGVTTVATSTADHIAAWGRIFPSVSNRVNVERGAGGGGSIGFATTFTVYAVEWGTEWNIQRATVSGTSGGNGVSSPGDYDTVGISSVVRDNTFVIASGTSTDNGLGDGFEGAIWTLGNGVFKGANANTVALGSEYTDLREAEVYVHTHSRIHVDYQFGTDGGSGIPSGALAGTATVAAALAPEERSGNTTAGYRFAIVSNTSNGTGNAYPRPLVWARHTANSTITWTRSRSGQPGAYWMQSIDFGDLWQ